VEKRLNLGPTYRRCIRRKHGEQGLTLLYRRSKAPHKNLGGQARSGPTHLKESPFDDLISRSISHVIC